MNTFLRLAGLGTLLLGLQLFTPERSSATVINHDLSEFSCVEQSTTVLPINHNYDPPNNGGPSSGSNQGSGTR